MQSVHFFVKTSIFSSPYDLYGSIKNLVLHQNLLDSKSSKE